MTWQQEMTLRYMDQPNEISLETLAMCNAACTFCPYPTVERKGTRMSQELIDRLVGEMESFTQPFFFSPFKLNEPLLDKRTLPLCRAVNERVPNAMIRLFTNGAALTDDNMAQIHALTNVHQLWVSLNSHIPEEYEKLMGIPFERTAKNLDRLHASSFRHSVMLSCVGYPNEEFRRYCFDRWPKFESFAIKKESLLGFTDAQYEDVPDSACIRWFELSITAEGIASHCCQDSEAKFPIGDVKRQTLLEIYNSPHWRERREKMMSRKMVPDSSPCRGCAY